MGLLAWGHLLALPCAEPNLGLPAESLERCRELFQAQWQVTTDCGRIPVGPGPFDQGTPGLGLASFRHAALLTPCPTRIFRGREPEIMHELSGVLEAGQVAQCRHGGDRPGALHTAQGLEGLDHRS